MFWRSRWMYSGEPGAGPEASAVAAVDPTSAAHAIAAASFLTSNIPLVPPVNRIAKKTYPAGGNATPKRAVADRWAQPGAMRNTPLMAPWYRTPPGAIVGAIWSV